MGCRACAQTPAQAYSESVKRVIAFVLLLWLPLQGVAALTMPFCRHAEQSSASTVTGRDAQTHAAHAHAGQAHDHRTPARPGDARGADTLACNDCGACHLACAPAVPSHAADAAAPLPGTPRLGPPPFAPPTVVLELLNPPPLSRG